MPRIYIRWFYQTMHWRWLGTSSLYVNVCNQCVIYAAACWSACGVRSLRPSNLLTNEQKNKITMVGLRLRVFVELMKRWCMWRWPRTIEQQVRFALSIYFCVRCCDKQEVKMSPLLFVVTTHNNNRCSLNRWNGYIIFDTGHTWKNSKYVGFYVWLAIIITMVSKY